MSNCCDASGYPGVFNRRTAARDVRSFMKKGLDSTANPMVAALRARGIEGASVLEIGAGSGTALISMLESGASSAIGVDISPVYETAAAELFERRGLQAPLEWHTGDFVALADQVAVSDVVFLNRVVCCYPDMDAIVDAAAAKTGRFLAMAYPRDRWGTRMFIRMTNAWLRFRRNSFRVFVHDPEAVASRAVAAGLEEAAAGTTAGWHWKVWERASARDL